MSGMVSLSRPDQEAPVMFGLVLLAALAQPAPEPAAPGGMAPEQALAVIDAKGKLTITRVGCACAQEMTVTKGADKEAVQVKVKVTSLTLTTAELPAKYVEAYTADGKPVTPEKLATLLARERPVLVAGDGKKADPFYLALYKEDTIVLVPPANTLAATPMGFYGAAPVIPPPVPPGADRAPLPPPPPEERKPN
jgi:hypothetical protein